MFHANKTFQLLFVRIVAFVLALILGITSIPISIVYADGVQDTAGNTGGGGTKTNPGSEYMGWYNQTQGYRMYIINADLERISPVYDFCKEKPTSFYSRFEDGDVDYKWTTRFDTANSPKTGNQMKLFSDLQDWCSNETVKAKLPPDIYIKKGKYVGNGEAFKNWFFAGQGGTSIDTGSRTPSTKPSGSTSSTGTTGTTSSTGTTGSTGTGNIKEVIFCGLCGKETTNLIGICFDCSYSVYGRCSSCNRALDASFHCSVCSTQEIVCIQCGKNKTTNTTRICNSCTVTVKVKYSNSHWASTSSLPVSIQEMISGGKTILNAPLTSDKINLGKTEVNNAMINRMVSMINTYFNAVYSLVANIHPNDAVEYAVGYSVIVADINHLSVGARQYLFITARDKFKQTDTYEDAFYYKETLTTAPDSNHASNTRNSLLSVQIPLAGDSDAETQEIAPASVLVKKADTITFPNGEYATAAEALNDGCYLVVEPLVGFRIQKGTNPKQYERKWTYGSFWNQAQEEWIGNNWYSGFNTNLCNFCLVTGKEVTTNTGKIIYALAEDVLKKSDTSSGLTIAESKSLMAKGYGLSMHIYDAKPVEEVELGETSTYDEGLGEEIGAAPDDSKEVSEDVKGEKASEREKGYVNIIKFYEDYDKESNEVRYSVYTRTPAPLMIELEDENGEGEPGYEVVDWFTSDEYKDPMKEEGEQKYWEYKGGKIKNIIMTGTSAEWGEGGALGEEEIVLRNGTRTKRKYMRTLTYIGKDEKGEDIRELGETNLYILLKRGEARTSTYDEDLGEEIGAAPDDRKRLEEVGIEIPNGIRYGYEREGEINSITIVKYYEELDSLFHN